jgi:glycosyltransferase involved in cell wall biosynthesis
MTPDHPAPAVSVVVSTLDRPQRLARCLDALLAGSQLPDEVVVVDQGDPEAVQAVLDERAGRGVDLVHVVQRTRGLSVSQNAGVARATHEVVCVVDDDCVPDAGWVQVARREHGRADGPLLLTGRVLPLPADGDRVLPLSSRTSTDRAQLPADCLPWNIGTGGNFSISRSAYLRVGGNDERLGTGSPGRAGNDLDLFRRLQRAGVRALFEPDFAVQHERATVAEHRSRRWTYGFGVGACVALWRAQGDADAGRVLRAWVRLRLASLRRAGGRTLGSEVRILLGTVDGLLYGRRTSRRSRP